MALDLNISWDNIAKNTNYQNKTEKTSYKDDRFWSLSRDENGKGAAIIRLLVDKNSVPFISLFNCGLREYVEKDKSYAWYIRDLPSSIKAPDPLNELWSELYNCGANGKEEARFFSRRETFITNILVIKDPANPENNGKVFLWKFGKKLLDKFMSALNPSEQERELGETPKELFNPLKGNNIALKIKNVAGFPNYDDTSIMEASSAFKDEKEAENAILNKTYELNEFCSPEYFESYEDLKNDLVKFLRKYTPKKMSKDEFCLCVEKSLNVSLNEKNIPSYRKDAKNVEIEDDEIPFDEVEAPKKNTKKETSKKEVKKVETDETDEIDDLLDDLDL